MHGALDARRSAWSLLKEPPAVDALLHYSILGSCYGAFLACVATIWVAVTDFPPRELLFPFHRATDVEAASAHSAHADSVIEVGADGSLTLDGRNMGEAGDNRLHTLTFALLLREEEQGTAPPLVIRVSPQATHGRILEVLNALARAGSPGYILLFADTSADQMLWRD